MKRLFLVAFTFGPLLFACQKKGPPGANAAFRLGYFANITHAQAMIGAFEGQFAKALNRPIEFRVFRAGPAAMEGLLAGAIDAAYVGGGPAVIAHIRSEHRIKVIAGAASGGSILVALHARSPAELEGKRLAVPQIGNTQDIALRFWLKQVGLKHVEVLPQNNPEILALLRAGEIEGAWVPEPWGARMIAEAGAHLLLDERTLWEGGRMPTTVIVATQAALTSRREDLAALLTVHRELTQQAESDRERFIERTNAAFAHLSGKPLSKEVIHQAFSRMGFLIDPMKVQLKILADHAAEIGYLPAHDTTELVDTSIL